jgi:transcriptional regulator with XRE-family HTH domain
LKQLRLERALTQVDMARRFGIDRSFISAVERGKKSVSLPTLEVMALGFDLSLSDLMRTI